MTPASKEEIDLWQEQWEDMHILDDADDYEEVEEALRPDALWQEPFDETYDQHDDSNITYYDQSDVPLERVAVPDNGQPVAMPAYAYDPSSQSCLYPEAQEGEYWDQGEGWDSQEWGEEQWYPDDNYRSSDWQGSQNQWSGNG